MIEAAIRAIEADDEGGEASVSGFPADERNQEGSAQGKSEERAPDPGVVLVDENSGAPVKILNESSRKKQYLWRT